jgi:hypothetical protein
MRSGWMWPTAVLSPSGEPEPVAATGVPVQAGDRFRRPVRWLCGKTQISEARADAWAQEMFIQAVIGPSFTEALNKRQAELLAGEVTVQELDNWREEIQDLDQVQPTRFYTEEMKRRHQELLREVKDATARLLAQPDLQKMIDLPRVEGQLRELWSSWDMATKRSWLRRLVHRIEVKPAVSRSRASVPEDRLSPIWKL